MLGLRTVPDICGQAPSRALSSRLSVHHLYTKPPLCNRLAGKQSRCNSFLRNVSTVF